MMSTDKSVSIGDKKPILSDRRYMYIKSNATATASIDELPVSLLSVSALSKTLPLYPVEVHW